MCQKMAYCGIVPHKKLDITVTTPQCDIFSIMPILSYLGSIIKCNILGMFILNMYTNLH